MAIGSSNIRFQADWISIAGDQYRIQIVDNDFIGVAEDFKVNNDGFKLSYEIENNNITANHLTSKCEINILIENSSLETLIADITNAQEERFFILIFKFETNVWNLKWAGIILPDLISYPDNILPYYCQLSASDGIARLKDIDYPTSWETAETTIGYLTKIFSKLAISQFWGATSPFIRTHATWLHKLMFSGTPARELDLVGVAGLDERPT